MTEGILAVHSEKPVITIPNSCDFSIPVKSVHNQRIVEQPYLAYCGQIGFINGLEFLIPLAEQLKAHPCNIKLVIVGDGAKRKQLEADARKLNLLDDWIYFVGKLSKEETLLKIKDDREYVSAEKFMPNNILKSPKNTKHSNTKKTKDLGLFNMDAHTSLNNSLNNSFALNSSRENLYSSPVKKMEMSFDGIANTSINPISSPGRLTEMNRHNASNYTTNI